MYIPYSYNPDGTDVLQPTLSFQVSPWECSRYTIWEKPRQTIFVETISGSTYDPLGTTEGTQFHAPRIDLHLLYSGTTQELASVAIALEENYKGTYGVLKLQWAGQAYYSTFDVRCLAVSSSVPYQTGTLTVARYTMTFRQVGDSTESATP